MAKGWFKDSDDSQAAPVVDVNDVNHIASGTVVKGDISALNDIRIDGTVDGRVYSRGKVVLGERAVVTGALICQNADIWGKVDGDVYVQESLTVKSTSTIDANVAAGRFQMEMGATLNGSCNMITPEDFEKFVAEVVKVKLPVLP